MADRPPRDVNWIPDDATGIEVPTAPTQNAGWLVEIPPRQFFNWLWNRCSRWFHYLSGQSQEWIVIDSVNDNEKDYDTLAAYIADAPASGDKVLVKEDQTVTDQVVLPSNVSLKFLDGSSLFCATNIATSVLKLGSNPIIEGVLNIILSQTGVTAKAVEIDGDNAVGKINVENSSTGTLTTAYHINASKTGNRIDGFAQNTGGGTLTNVIVDDSIEDSNSLFIVDEINNIIISTSIVNVNAVQTLENKTLTSPIINAPSASGDVYGGTYTPVITGINNYASGGATVNSGHYARIGDTVHMSIRGIAVSPTAGSTLTSFRVTLPIASSLTTLFDCGGAGAFFNIIGGTIGAAPVATDIANNEARVDFYSTDTSSHVVSISFSYKVA